MTQASRKSCTVRLPTTLHGLNDSMRTRLCGNARKAEYDALVRVLLPADRAKLWDRCEQESWRLHPRAQTHKRLLACGNRFTARARKFPQFALADSSLHQ